MILSDNEVEFLKLILPKIKNTCVEAAYNSYSDQLEDYYRGMYDKCDDLLSKIEEATKSANTSNK